MGRTLQGIRNIIKKGIKRAFRKVIDKIYKKASFLYYSDLNRIPIGNWFEIMDGKMFHMSKFHFKYIPYFFYDNYVSMIFQMEGFPTELINKKADIALLNAEAARTGNKTSLFWAKEKENEIKIETESKKDNKPFTLMQFINFIELNLDCVNKIKPWKTSAGWCYSMYARAKEVVKDRNRRHRKNNAKQR